MARSSRLPKACDLVVTDVRGRILSERLPVGSRLASESELMEQHGLGRVTVREGLRLLERDGLIEIRRGAAGGIFVREVGIGQISETMALLFSSRDTTLREFADFRLDIEPTVARLAATHASDDQRAALTDIAGLGGDGRHVASFHELVADASGNGVHAIVLAALSSTLESQVRYDRVTAGTAARNVREHEEIAAAVAAGDPDAAESAMRRHLEAYRDFVAQLRLLDDPIIPRVHP
ncbi:DNA-binding FadR family transcriptional regulator [Nocardioides marinisabuli]|uniref:DNA-binding FadR family transcriptional regulator n=1 Tax=Nocardioides marinisabuli TaxID=419476 RepID=A0A7Y9F050_9ACTN|nr:FCD domain-containing protein [Nocardioides marinisabuli]NYD57179.1 DNA-binding FadR family transcriptional regulator [Nocardioides marinisabuli]